MDGETTRTSVGYRGRKREGERKCYNGAGTLRKEEDSNMKAGTIGELRVKREKRKKTLGKTMSKAQIRIQHQKEEEARDSRSNFHHQEGWQHSGTDAGSGREAVWETYQPGLAPKNNETKGSQTPQGGTGNKEREIDGEEGHEGQTHKEQEQERQRMRAGARGDRDETGKKGTQKRPTER